jgi:hypothetical protein
MDAVRSGRPGPSTAQCTCSPSSSARASRSASTPASGGLETTMTLGRRVGGERTQRLPGRAPTDGRLEVAAADAEAVRDADPGRVEQAHDLLGAGPRRGDDADRAGAHDVGEPEGDPADVGGAAVGPHDEHVSGGGGVLEVHLVLDGHVVGEEHHRQAGGDGVEGLGDGVLPRHRDDGQRGVHPGRGRAEGAGGDRVVAATGVARRPQRRERVGDGRETRRHGIRGVGAQGDDEVVRAGLAGTSNPMEVSTSTLSSVAMATCAASTPGVPATTLETCMRLTESW